MSKRLFSKEIDMSAVHLHISTVYSLPRRHGESSAPSSPAAHDFVEGRVLLIRLLRRGISELRALIGMDVGAVDLSVVVVIHHDLKSKHQP